MRDQTHPRVMTVTERKLANNPYQPVGRWITVKRRLAIYLRDGYSCLLCCRDLSMTDPYQITLDHEMPRYQGGGNDSMNLYTCCRDCNQRYRHEGRAPRVIRRVRSHLHKDLTPFLDAAAVIIAARESSC